MASPSRSRSSRQHLRVAAIDDQDIALQGIQFVLQAQTDIDIVAIASSVDEFLALGVAADVVILDLYFNGGQSTVPRIPDLVATGCRVLVYTSQERPFPLREAMRLGASGLLLKSDKADLAEAVRLVARAEWVVSSLWAEALLTDPRFIAGLTGRELEVVQYLADGLTTAETAKALGISVHTAREHIGHCKEKYRSLGHPAATVQGLIAAASNEGAVNSPPGVFHPRDPAP